MRKILEKNGGLKYDFPVVNITTASGIIFNISAIEKFDIQHGDRLLISENNGYLSIAFDSRLTPSKMSYGISNVKSVASKHFKKFDMGYYRIPDKPTEFDGKYEWYDLEKID